jgi:hypothetical protein
LAIAAAAVILLTAATFGFAATMEEKDSFCASCHTQPETTYFGRSQAAAAADLASFHHIQPPTNGVQNTPTRCIDCHSGSGVGGRVSVILQGAHNALAFYTRTAVQPAVLTHPIQDDNCLKCHSRVLTLTDFNNHWHNFLSRWQAADPNAAQCVTCHITHAAGGDPQIMFMSEGQTDQVCQSCHAVLRGGG